MTVLVIGNTPKKMPITEIKSKYDDLEFKYNLMSNMVIKPLQFWVSNIEKNQIFRLFFTKTFLNMIRTKVVYLKRMYKNHANQEMHLLKDFVFNTL